MYTWQDFVSDRNGSGIAFAVNKAITEHRRSEMYLTAIDADAYDHQRNTTIMNYARFLYTDGGRKAIDPTVSNHRLCSSFFRRLNTQRMTYSLGNGITFTEDGVKEMLGSDFDTQMRTAGYYALIHGVAFAFLNVDHVHVFTIREFVPLVDEDTGALMAGIRFWKIAHNKPMTAILYEVDGYTKLRNEISAGSMKVVEDKRAYRYAVEKTEFGEPEIVGEENYSELPIVPVYGSRLKQSTLVGMKESIDAFDLIRSGFANDLADCAEVYWLIGNAGGMDDADMSRFRERLKLRHMAAVTDADNVTVTPYTQEIPTNARKAFLEEIRSGIYEDFGGLDVHAVAAGATNDHIEAAYQPMDENADDYEYQIIEAVQGILRLIGIDDTPQFKRNRISNQKEQTEMVLLSANYLDEETVLKLLPFITPEMVEEIIERKGIEDIERMQPFEGGVSDEVGLEA